MARTCVALFLAMFLVTIPAAAQTLSVRVPAGAPVAVPSTDAIAVPTPIRIPAATRPSVLPSMYVSLGALQGYDAYSTLRAVKQGAVEANPMMTGMVGNPAAFLAVKGATTVTTIYVAERLWRQQRRGAAIALVAVVNGMMAVVAAHNASVLGAQR